MNKTVYRLRDKTNADINNFIGVSIYTETYDYDDTHIIFELEKNCYEYVFETDSAEKAEWVRHNKNAQSSSYDYPSNPYNTEDLEVVKVDIVEYETIIQEVHIPTKLDIYIQKLQKDKGYALIIHDYIDYCRKHNINPDNDYSYDLNDITINNIFRG